MALKEGKIHLHKLNGIKIAVPVIKMSMEDIDYVEQVTSQSLDDSKSPSSTKQTNGSGARIEKKPDYDWFDFFLRSGVSPYQCERYSHNFNKDSIDEAILADLTPEILRNLGLKEGDIIRVMKYLDTTYSRLKQSKRQDTGATNEVGVVDEGGLFSGAGGALKNNTRKGRPAPPVQTNDIIDLKKFQQGDFIKPPVPEKDFLDASDAPPLPAKDTRGGFDDNAWDVKPLNKGQAARSPGIGKSPTTPTTSVAIEPPVAKQQLTGAMKDLSLLDEPLVPIVTHTGASTQTRYSSANGAQAQPQPASLQQFTQSQPVGASSVLFNQLVASQPTGVAQQPMQNQSTGLGMMMQPTSQFQSQPLPRQRPQAPTIPQQYGGIMPPPPIRPVSAPLIAQQQQHSFALPPLQPQLTGMPYQNTGFGVNPQQTLNDMAQIRAQQQTNSPPLQHQFTGFPNQQINTQPLQMQQTGFNQGLHPQMTGIPQQNPYLLGQQIGSPFADPRYGTQQLQPQMTGYGSQNPLSPTYYQPLAPQQTGGINSILPAPLQPQITGINGSLNRPLFGQPPVPPIPSVFQSNGPLPTLSYPLSMQSMPTGQPMLSPLQPQKTGPAPNISFGLQPEVPKLVAQPTGRRANLSQASKYSLYFYIRE